MGVQSPNQTVKGQTVADVWDGKIRTMGSGSDFTAFQDFAGIPSIDFGFSADVNDKKAGAVYHYHSNYDSYYWMNTYGDPGFHYHIAIAKIFGLFTARLAESPVIPLNATDYHIAIAKIFGLFTASLAESPVIPLNATDYAIALDGYISNVESKVDSAIMGVQSEEEEMEARARPVPAAPKGDLLDLKLSFRKLHKAALKLKEVAQAHDSWGAKLAEEAGENIPWWKWYSKIKLYYQIRRVNDKYKYLERQFLYDEGLDGRPWFKHVVYAPGLWTGYAGAVFPGLVEAIDDKDYGLAQKWVGIIEGTLWKAYGSLK